jgi:alpha-1,2-mannosyltransferase
MDAIAPARPATPRWLLVTLAVVFVAVNVHYSLKIVQTVERSGESAQSRSALMRWMPQLVALRDGEDAYRKFNYPNPPVMAMLLMPLTYLPATAAALVWFYLKAGLAVVAVIWTFRIVEGEGPPFPAWAKGVTVLLSLRPLVGDLSHGNVNILILFLVVGALYAFRHRRDGLAGLTLALAIACKVTPALFLPYLVYKRAWRALVGCAAGLVLFLAVLPGAYFGFGHNLTLLASWSDGMVRPFVIDGQVTPEHQNQSLPGLVYRLLTHSPAFTTYVEDEATGVDVYTPVSYLNVIDIGRGPAKLLLKGLMLAFAGLVVWSCWNPVFARPFVGKPRGPTGDAATRGRWTLAAEFALVLVGMLLFSERTWKHHGVTLVLPFAVLAYAAALPSLARVLRATAGAALVLVAALTWGTSESVLGKDGADLAMAYGCYTAAFAVLAGVLVVLLRATRPAEPAAARPAFRLVGGRLRRAG